MGYKFMSDEWFEKVKDLTEEVNPEIPAATADMKVNITMTSDEGDKDLCMAGGKMEKGHMEGATVKIILPIDLAQKMFIDQDKTAGMQAFMSGKMKIEGDMSKMMAMQNIQPTESQNILTEKIREITE